jgi:hypothetical protein
MWRISEIGMLSEKILPLIYGGANIYYDEGHMENEL